MISNHIKPHSPWLHSPQSPHFTGAHVNGLHPFRVTPTRGSTIIDPLRILDSGEPHILCILCTRTCAPPWVFTLNPHLGHSQVSANSLQQRKIAQNLINLNETQIQLSRAGGQLYVHIMSSTSPLFLVLGRKLNAPSLGSTLI